MLKQKTMVREKNVQGTCIVKIYKKDMQKHKRPTVV